MPEMRFSEAEANEILSAAVRIAAPGKITREELAIVAAQVGISEADLAAAEEKHDRLKTEEGLREEFHTLRVQSWRNMLFYLVSCSFFFALGHIRTGFNEADPVLLFILVPTVAYYSYITLSPRSSPYKQAFDQWRNYRVVRLPQERSDALIERIVAIQLRARPSTSLLRLRFSVARTLRCDWKRAGEAVHSYLESHPEAKARIGGAK